MCANAFYPVLGAKYNACYVGRQRFLDTGAVHDSMSWIVVLYELNTCLTKLLGNRDVF